MRPCTFVFSFFICLPFGRFWLPSHLIKLDQVGISFWSNIFDKLGSPRHNWRMGWLLLHNSSPFYTVKKTSFISPIQSVRHRQTIKLAVINIKQECISLKIGFFACYICENDKITAVCLVKLLGLVQKPGFNSQCLPEHVHQDGYIVSSDSFKRNEGQRTKGPFRPAPKMHSPPCTVL